jgi:acetyl esterase/lipase
VSYYGITDMVRYHEDALHLLGTPEQCAQPAPVEDRFSASIKEMVGMDFRHMPTHEQMMKNVMGGSPEDAPEMYRLGSPVHQVHAQCPPTLLLQGEHDSITSAESVRELYARLNEVGVPVVLVEFPQTEHAFDVMLPLLSPAAQSALYDVDHFLALMI